MIQRAHLLQNTDVKAAMFKWSGVHRSTGLAHQGHKCTNLGNVRFFVCFVFKFVSFVFSFQSWQTCNRLLPFFFCQVLILFEEMEDFFIRIFLDGNENSGWQWERDCRSGGCRCFFSVVNLKAERTGNGILWTGAGQLGVNFLLMKRKEKKWNDLVYVCVSLCSIVAFCAVSVYNIISSDGYVRRKLWRRWSLLLLLLLLWTTFMMALRLITVREKRWITCVDDQGVFQDEEGDYDEENDPDFQPAVRQRATLRLLPVCLSLLLLVHLFQLSRKRIY